MNAEVERTLDRVIERQNQHMGALYVQMKVLRWISQNTTHSALDTAEELSQLLTDAVEEVKRHGI